MNNRYILSIGAGENQLILIHEIKKMGFSIISCDLDSNAPGKELSDIFLNISTHNANLIMEEIVKLQLNLVGVITRSTGEPVVTTSIIAEKFNLCAVNSDVATLLTDKSLFIRKMNELNIPSPALYMMGNNFNSKQFNFPVFVKPSKTNISHAAMNKCEDIDQLESAYRKALAVTKNNVVNIEEYLLGRDLVSIDFVFNNEIIHIATIGEISTGEPNFDGIGWYSCKDNLQINEVFCKIKDKLNIKYGFFQSAMKVDVEQSKASVYEIHAEIGGDYVNDVFLPNITDGYNIFENNILLSIGIKPASCTRDIKPTVILFNDKIREFSLSYLDPLIDNLISADNYILLFFKNYTHMEQYLNKMSMQTMFSINNKCKGE